MFTAPGKHDIFYYMKKDLHPRYFPGARASCACGHSFSVGSTKEYMEIEVCSNCHPFYTGKEKLMDTMGRVEKFRKRLAQKEAMKTGGAKRKAKRQ